MIASNRVDNSGFMNKEAIAAAFRALGKTKAEISYQISNREDYHFEDGMLIIPDSEDAHFVRAMADMAAANLRFHDAELHRELKPQAADAREIYDALERTRGEILLAKRYAGAFENIKANKDFGNNPAANLAELLWSDGMNLPLAKKSLLQEWATQNAQGQFSEMLENLDNQRDFAESVHKFLDFMAGNNAQNEPSEDSESYNAEKIENESDGDFSEEEGDGEEHDSKSATQEKSDGGKLANPKPSKSKEPDAMPNYEPISNMEYEPELEYKVYTKEFDEIVYASALAGFDELKRLRAQLDNKIADLKTITNRLASRLQQLLMAPQDIWWELDKDEGSLDASRFARFIASPANENIYKHRIESDFKDTVVTLLIDNSGSMRGRPIMSAVACADILARVLEQCGVKVEVLGFTTAEWKGGQARQKWQKSGAPKNPGRLNDLRHIIYKSADLPWRASKRNLALALKEGLLKENIDGEAILWASSRLMNRPEARKILMVISDGAPVDDSTMAVNVSNYLDSHLRKVINNIEHSNKLELLAIGIGHDVGRYYKNAVTIMDINDLGETMIGKMEELFGKAA